MRESITRFQSPAIPGYNATSPGTSPRPASVEPPVSYSWDGRLAPSSVARLERFHRFGNRYVHLGRVKAFTREPVSDVPKQPVHPPATTHLGRLVRRRRHAMAHINQDVAGVISDALKIVAGPGVGFDMQDSRRPLQHIQISNF